MALLQVRNFPDDIYNSLMLLAQYECRSISQQTIVLIKAALGEQTQQQKLREERLRNMSEEVPEISGEFPSPADLIREDRER